MLGLCIIGSHEPCFSVSHFFSKNDDTYKSQYEKFSSLLFNLKAQVEEAENNHKGGEQQMEELEKEVVEESVPKTEEVEEKPAENFEEVKVEESTTENEVVEEFAAEETVTENTEPSEFEALQQQFKDLETSYNELQTKFEQSEAHVAELEASQTSLKEELESFKAKNTELQTTITSYEAEKAEKEEERKEELIKKYEKVLMEEEINPIRDMVKDFSYDELNSKLAIMFADKQITGSEELKKVPLPEPEESQFALLMKKYRK